MVTKIRMASTDTENIEKSKSTNIIGKDSKLLNKFPSKRPALGDRTNQEHSKVNVIKPALKKPITNVIQNVKTQIILPQKSNISKPELKIIKKPAETKSQPIVHKRPSETKLTAYSVKHFGLVEENDVDYLLVPIYVNDIVAYLRNLELKYIVDQFFLTGHKTTARMRSVLVNWLIEVHFNFKLVQETLFLCISIVDRYLQKNKIIGRENLQLVGITALFIASKYEEIYAPEISDLVYVCDDLFNKKKICQMEQSILKLLGWNFGSPCALHFLRRYSKVAKVEPNQHTLGKYFIELVLIEHDFSYIAPSLVAAASIVLSIRLLSPENISQNAINIIEHISCYKPKIYTPVIKKLANTILKAETSKYQAVKNKYAGKSYCSISTRTELKNGLIRELAES